MPQKGRAVHCVGHQNKRQTIAMSRIRIADSAISSPCLHRLIPAKIASSSPRGPRWSAFYVLSVAVAVLSFGDNDLVVVAIVQQLGRVLWAISVRTLETGPSSKYIDRPRG